MFNLIRKLKNLKEGMIYGTNVYKSRCFTMKAGMEKLSYNNYSLYHRLGQNILPYNDFIIVDVGANNGWFAKIMYCLDPKSKVISFEPLKSQQKYLETLKEKVPGYKYIDKAVGDKEGKQKIYEFGSSGLSSFRKITQGSYNDSEFNKKVVASYEVDTVTLDKVFEKEDEKLLVKIDTQGYEINVLKGMEKLIASKKIACIIIELVVIEKYEGGASAPEIIDFLTARGFELFDLNPFFYESLTGQMSEFDAVFINRKVCNLRNIK
ncbi:MAG: FkbM family methyltransferase [bacterium]|nr:FkbM family methyltransferase [bacterium]